MRCTTKREDARSAWYRHWIKKGLLALEAGLSRGVLCYGDMPALADLCLVRQVFNTHRFQIDTQPYQTIQRLLRIYDVASTLDAFILAAPGRQTQSESLSLA